MPKNKNKWKNLGDINILEHGGCLVQKSPVDGYYNVICLMTPICDYHGKYRKPCIVSRCYVDIDSWTEEKDLHEINSYTGNPESFIPETEEEKEQYAADLVNYYGIGEFDPCFPAITRCSSYGWNYSDAIVGKTAAARFLKENGVPVEWRR